MSLTMIFRPLSCTAARRWDLQDVVGTPEDDDRQLRIEALAAWVVADQGWKAEQVHQMKETGERFDLTLKQPVPLYFAYVTAWATQDGAVHFRRDIYQKDGVGAAAGAY